MYLLVKNDCINIILLTWPILTTRDMIYILINVINRRHVEDDNSDLSDQKMRNRRKNKL